MHKRLSNQTTSGYQEIIININQGRKMEHKKFEVKIEDKALIMNTDFDQDGKESSKLKLFLSEGIQELFDKGIKKEDVKLVDFEFGPSGIKIVVDTDQDGESLMEYEVSFGESFDEAYNSLKK